MKISPSIFGWQPPKFVSGTDEVLLDYWVTMRDEPEDQGLRHQSVINHYRTWIDRGEHWAFEGSVNLFKYNDPLAKWTEINSKRGDLVTLWRRRDKDAFKDTAGNIVPFKFRIIIPIWIEAKGFPDRLILKFESQQPVDIDKQTIATLITESGTEIITETGTQNIRL